MEVQLIKSDDTKTLMARGEHDMESIIDAAIAADEIDESYRDDYLNGTHLVTWMRATPRDGYSTWYYEAKEASRGAFKASLVTILW